MWTAGAECSRLDILQEIGQAGWWVHRRHDYSHPHCSCPALDRLNSNVNHLVFYVLSYCSPRDSPSFCDGRLLHGEEMLRQHPQLQEKSMGKTGILFFDRHPTFGSLLSTVL